MGDERFSGRIAGVGTTSGVRVVVGTWADSPLGAFTDVMLADADGVRHLLAPSWEIADYVAATYSFDQVVIGDVTLEEDATGWQVTGPGLDLHLVSGRRAPLGVLLRMVPPPLATAPAWTAVTDPVARRVMRGVRTRGTAREGRQEFYGATDLRGIVAVSGSWRGDDLGTLAAVSPEPGFGFGSTPERPSMTTLVTTVRR